MITSHAWRPLLLSTTQSQRAALRATPKLERPCAFTNCGQGRAEHERSVSGKFAGRWPS